jgi:hypothetical protein
MLPLRRGRSTTSGFSLVKWPGCLRQSARATEIDVTGHSSSLTAQK